MELNKKIFERSGYSVQCAEGIAGARKQLLSYTPDGIILDKELPDGTGFDYCRRLREEYTVPIMMLSNEKEDEAAALKAGASDFIKKPYDFDVMIDRIGLMIEKKVPLLSKEDWVKVEEQSEETATETPVKKKNYRFGIPYVVAAACFILLASQIGMYGVLNDRDENLQISDFETPLADYPVETQQDIVFPDVGSVTIPADAQDVKIFLYNPEVNSCYLSFEIILKDYGESIYLSGLIKPGVRIEDVALLKGIEEGEYSAILRIRAYTLKGFSDLGSMDMEFCLNVGSQGGD